MHAVSAAPHCQYFSDFAAALRYWRSKRGYSQLQLSTISSVSQRHISFLEKGRSQPSKELIFKLGMALDVPLRQRNIMLLAAGFAPAYQERRLSDPELAPVRKALDFMLAQQSPYPALVVDRLWNLQMANASAWGLIRWLLNISSDQEPPAESSVNVLKMMFDPNGLRQFMVNWQAVCSDLLHWIQREAMSDGPGSEATALLDELVTLVGSDLSVETPDLDRHILPFLPVQLCKDGVDLNLFTTIATLGTPKDVTLHELRVESFFPADDATSEWFRARASSGYK